jgi:hypothetical protein
MLGLSPLPGRRRYCLLRPSRGRTRWRTDLLPGDAIRFLLIRSRRNKFVRPTPGLFLRIGQPKR